MIAAELIRRGHAPDTVRERMGFDATCWSLMQGRSKRLEDAIAGWQQRRAQEMEARLERQAREDPKAALAYARLLEQRKLNRARLRLIARELGEGPEDAQKRFERTYSQFLRELPEDEFCLLLQLQSKVRSDLPFDQKETELAARHWRTQVKLSDAAAGEGADR
jgi:hypothetical protein